MASAEETTIWLLLVFGALAEVKNLTFCVWICMNMVECFCVWTCVNMVECFRVFVLLKLSNCWDFGACRIVSSVLDFVLFKC